MDVAGVEASRGEQLRCGLALEQQLLFGHLHQDETDQFPHVHAADHLFKPANQHTKRQDTMHSHLPQLVYSISLYYLFTVLALRMTLRDE